MIAAGFLGISKITVAGDNDKPQPRVFMIPFNNFQPADQRHIDIHQDNGRTQCFDLLTGFFALGGDSDNLHVCTAAADHLGQSPPGQGFIITNQYFPHVSSP